MSFYVQSSVSIGFSVAVIDEDGTQQLHITEVKAGGLASAKGMYSFFNNTQNMKCVIYHTLNIQRVDFQT